MTLLYTLSSGRANPHHCSSSLFTHFPYYFRIILSSIWGGGKGELPEMFMLTYKKDILYDADHSHQKREGGICPPPNYPNLVSCPQQCFNDFFIWDFPYFLLLILSIRCFLYLGVYEVYGFQLY